MFVAFSNLVLAFLVFHGYANLFFLFSFQAIVSSDRTLDNPTWQVHETLLRRSLLSYPKLLTALFPVTTSVDGMEPQDITVYQLLQVNIGLDVTPLKCLVLLVPRRVIKNLCSQGGLIGDTFHLTLIMSHYIRYLYTQRSTHMLIITE